MPKELQESFLAITNYIITSSKYKEYQELANQMKQNSRLMDLINEIKKIQKEIVHLEFYKKDSTVALENYQKLLEELNEYPIYQSYNNAKKEVNDMLQYVKTKIELVLSEIINP